MNLNLKDKVIIVSGGARGIGQAITRLLSIENAIPVILGRSPEHSIRLVDELHMNGLKADFVTVELKDPKQCASAISTVVNKYGRIDGLINNAGVNDGVGLENGSYDKFIESIHSNLIHYYLLAHHSLPWLIKSKGSIVNIGSKTAETGQGGTSAYAASNGGRNALTREWAVELLNYGIRVNAVIVAECYTPLYESWINSLDDPEGNLARITSSIPLENRFTTSEEIANMVLFLLSEKSSHTTGQLIHVDGGYVHLDRSLNQLT
jgi:L-fucose dehydrogenase